MMLSSAPLLQAAYQITGDLQADCQLIVHSCTVMLLWVIGIFDSLQF